MSRTLRRNKKQLIRNYCGLPENIDKWDKDRYGGNTVEETYARRVRWYTRDHHKGMFTAPSWWNNMFFNRPHRRKEQQKLQRHIKYGDWDNHTPDKPHRVSRVWWF